jgi:hypothetical protein
LIKKEKKTVDTQLDYLTDPKTGEQQQDKGNIIHLNYGKS